MTKSAQNCSKLDPIFCFSKFLQLKSILDDFLQKYLISREKRSREKDNFHFQGLKSEDMVSGQKGKFLVIKSWMSKSGVGFLIRCIFDLAVTFGLDLQKRPPQNFELYILGFPLFLPQFPRISSLFLVLAPLSYQNFGRGVHQCIPRIILLKQSRQPTSTLNLHTWS